MPDRAELSLSEISESLEQSLASASNTDRGGLEQALVWCHVETGALGEAFAVLWNEATAMPPAVRTQLRAELQALCGNEDAALTLLASEDADESLGSLVRARVAAARGDWAASAKHAAGVLNGMENRARAMALAARAALELDRAPDALAFVAAADPKGVVASLESALVEACANDRDAEALLTVAERATIAGALRIAADAWADLARARNQRGDEAGARRFALRAVELWDDMATSLPPPLRAGFWKDARRSAARSLSKRPKVAKASKPRSSLAALLENLRRLASERDLPALLPVITDGAIALSGAERGFVLLVDDEGAFDAHTVRTAHEEMGPKTAAFSTSIAETVLIDGEAIVTVDAENDARVQDYLSVHQLMLKSIACLPIRSRHRAWGVLYLEHRSLSGRFSGADLTLLRAYADQAAIAIETSQLLEQVATQQHNLAAANEELRYTNEMLEQRMVGQHEELQRSRRELARLHVSRSEGTQWGLIGASQSMRALFEVIDRVAMSEVPVVVSGESGTGKELVARAIHQSSARADNPFVPVNCAAIPEGLLESELFGHVAGSFTGATGDRRGVFSEAEGGTLFLDEVSDMPARMQLDLLRVLQERRVRQIGGSEDAEIDVRLVTASNRPLSELVDEGKIREDLYYRLAVVELKVPPLRDRADDIPLLCEHFLGRIAKERDEPRRVLSREAIQRLLRHGFSGNVRELEHLLVNAVVFAKGTTIEADELALGDPTATPARVAAPTSYEDFKGDERDRIVAALNSHGWNRAKAARALGMARRTFYRRLKEHGIELP